jgi:hypothetical protein
MQVIGHDHVSANCDVEIRYTSLSIIAQRFLNDSQRRKSLAMQGAHGHEKQGLTQRLKNFPQSRWAPLYHWTGVVAAVLSRNAKMICA